MTSMPDRPPLGPTASLERPLTVPLLVRGSLDSSGLIALFLVGAFFVGFAALMWWTERANDHFASGFFLLLGCLILLPALVIGGLRWRRRRWLEVTLTGFLLTRRGRTVPFRDEQVVGVSQKSKRDSNGVLHRDVRLEIRQDGELL